MEGFDTITMSYLAPQMSLNHVTSPDPLSMPMLPLDGLEHHSNYDAETYVGSEDATFAQHGFQQQQPLQRMPGGYEDPFSDALSGYDQQPQPEHNGATETSSIDSNHKLLSFSLPVYNYQLLDYQLRRTSISLSAQLHGMFFLAESPWATVGDAAGPPSELTCYRRNLFQITGQITLPRTLHSIYTDKNEQIPIIAQELSISATESVEGNSVKIISVPWKTPANGAQVVEDKSEKEPPSIPLELSNGQEMDSEFVNFPIAWKRLQFRIATANNGRRKELQQHFVVRIKLMATLHTGQKIPVAEVHSGAIIVRGRSPRNFQSRKDFPISAGGSTARKSSHMPNQVTRHSSGDSTQTANNFRAERQESKSSRPDVPPIPFQYDTNDLQMSQQDFFDWKMPTQPGAMTAIPEPINLGQNGGQAYAQSTPDLGRNAPPSRAPQAPITLSLTEDEPKQSPTQSDGGVRKAVKMTPRRAHSFSLNLISSPDESADLLYEYFPLGLDDWMPPVDAVYRPHVVHHTNLPQDPKAIAVKNRSKRYFAETEA
ncbi:p53-like transcription factor [Pseudovirgaria hyperparasitica]|uniref:p53-like transcription factor n=1 Tax=Pseudovirgaria hyperparasitica TaxID=470096 RepID=A0A6A6WF91_9PEZI|nr:p53-like transcription factor [Pseudovirgaria hyperparasitica]KAF2761393.1 p53-like transcription factor [Pseudovirgaria hyperparasitica]